MLRNFPLFSLYFPFIFPLFLRLLLLFTLVGRLGLFFCVLQVQNKHILGFGRRTNQNGVVFGLFFFFLKIRLQNDVVLTYFFLKNKGQNDIVLELYLFIYLKK